MSETDEFFSFLTNFWPVFHFITSWKLQKTSGFRPFSWVKEWNIGLKLVRYWILNFLIRKKWWSNSKIHNFDNWSGKWFEHKMHFFRTIAQAISIKVILSDDILSYWHSKYMTKSKAYWFNCLSIWLFPPQSRTKKKNQLTFLFTTSTAKGFMKDLKAFIKPFKALQRAKKCENTNLN